MSVDELTGIQALEAYCYDCQQLRIVADNLNTHQSEELVRYVAQRSEFEGDLGIKGRSGILKSQASRAEFLSRPEHKIVFRAPLITRIALWLIRGSGQQGGVMPEC